MVGEYGMQRRNNTASSKCIVLTNSLLLMVKRASGLLLERHTKTLHSTDLCFKARTNGLERFENLESLSDRNPFDISGPSTDYL